MLNSRTPNNPKLANVERHMMCKRRKYKINKILPWEFISLPLLDVHLCILVERDFDPQTYYSSTCHFTLVGIISNEKKHQVLNERIGYFLKGKTLLLMERAQTILNSRFTRTRTTRKTHRKPK